MASAVYKRPLLRLITHQNNCIRQFRTTSVWRQQSKNDGVSENTEAANDIEAFASETRLSSIDEFRRDMKPFMKELFCGRFDKLVLSYADVLKNDRFYNCESVIATLQSEMEARKSLIQDIQSQGRISKDLIMSLRSQGFFGHRGAQAYEGQGYSVTESLRFLEELAGQSVSLSNVIANSAWYGAEVLRRFGSEDLKQKYLSALHNGTSICAMCVADKNAGFDVNSTHASFIQDQHHGSVTLNCEKMWVTNATNTDLYIVWGKQVSKYSEEGGHPSARLAAYLVDAKQSKGITVHEQDYNTRGLGGCGIRSVTFKDVEIPIENQLAAPGNGFHVLTESLKDEAKLAGSVQVLAALRKILNATVKHCHLRRAFGDELSNYSLVQNKLGGCAIQLFGLESAIYMTAGLADFQKNPDYCLEATACRLLAADATRQIVNACKSLLGSSTFLADNEISCLADDLEGLNWWESGEDLNKLYLGLGGLSYSADSHQDAVTDRFTPTANLFKLFKKGRNEGEFSTYNTQEPELKWKLHEDVHPSLIELAKALEVQAIKFHRLTRHYLLEYGADIQLQEVEVCRLAKMATYVYAMTSVLARASRGYCDGFPHANEEVKICTAYILLTDPILRHEYEMGRRSAFDKIDPYLQQISQYMSENGRYANVHPVSRTLY